ncbi:MAG TPA: glycosyltransferase [Steroidobacteraceae bacterium]|nr:glycosyltransferase [Steroidobacteraceae bacterium]
MSNVLNVAAPQVANRIEVEPARNALQTTAEMSHSLAPSAINVVMLGPALDVMGGIASVERLIVAGVPAHVRVQHIPTMRDGGGLTKAWVFAASVLRFNRQLRQMPDVVHVHFASGASSKRKMILAALAQRRGARVILHAHGGYYRNYWDRIGAREKALASQVFRNVSALIVLGESWRDFFACIGVPRSKIVVLPNPVSLPSSVPVRHANSKVRAVYLGLMSQTKGTFDLVEAVERLPRPMRDRLHLVIAGNGEIAAIRKKVEERGLRACIEVRGWQTAQQRDDLLAQSEIFVLPSYFEGLPMAMLEAMAWGLAPVCTPVGSVGDVIASEVNGLLVRPGDIDALAASLSRLIEDSTTRARIAARARLSVEPLSLDRYVSKLTAVYAAVAANRPLTEIV